MANIARHPRPLLADVHCTPMRFNPGDRLLVETNGRLSDDQKKRLTKSICKWAGCEVEVLIYSLMDMKITPDLRLPGKVKNDGEWV